MRLILGSASSIRGDLLRRAGLAFEQIPARIDEQALRASLEAEQAAPRDIADALAEFKARKIADKHPDAMVIGCDQILHLKGQIFEKCDTLDEAQAQIAALSGQTHMLISAVVVYENAKPVWRHIETVRLTMRALSKAAQERYLSYNWPGIADAVGCYKLEHQGVRLFSAVQGDYFAVLGLPLLPLLSYLAQRGVIET